MMNWLEPEYWVDRGFLCCLAYFLVFTCLVTALFFSVAYIATWGWEHRPGERLIELHEREWVCSATHVEHVPVTISGKTHIPSHDETVCDQWTRRP